MTLNNKTPLGTQWQGLTLVLTYVEFHAKVTIDFN